MMHLIPVGDLKVTMEWPEASQLLISNPRVNIYFLTLTPHDRGDPHLEGPGLPVSPAHLGHRSTFHSTPQARPLFSELGSRDRAAGHPAGSGAHSQSARLCRYSGTDSLVQTSLRCGKWPHRTHSCHPLELGFSERKAEGRRKKRKGEREAHSLTRDLWKIGRTLVEVVPFLVQTTGL